MAALFPFATLHLSGFFYTNIDFSQENRGGWRSFLTTLYKLHLLHRNVDISWAIAADSSPMHIASDRIRAGKAWFWCASHKPLSYVPFPSIECSKFTGDYFDVLDWFLMVSPYLTNCLLPTPFLYLKLLGRKKVTKFILEIINYSKNNDHFIKTFK